MLGVEIGQPAGQAVWEAYTMLLAFKCWLSPATQGKVLVVGDAKGAMRALIKRSARSEKLNPIVQEAALVLAKCHKSLEGIHVFSEHNIGADLLSRIADPGGKPVDPKLLLGAIEVVSPEASDWDILGA
jgi:hypothetical protein